MPKDSSFVSALKGANIDDRQQKIETDYMDKEVKKSAKKAVPKVPAEFYKQASPSYRKSMAKKTGTGKRV